MDLTLKKQIEEITARRKDVPKLKTASFTIDSDAYEIVSTYLQKKEVSFSALINEYIKDLCKQIKEEENKKK